MSLSAASELPPNRPACALCLITSVGTRTAHAATSPIDEARECAKNRRCHGADPSSSAGRRQRLMLSYVMKKVAAPGAEPRSTEGRPA